MSLKQFENGSDPEDILSSSLTTLYDYAPITYSDPGKVFTYTSTPRKLGGAYLGPLTVTLDTPDTQPSNWSLYASYIWMSSIYIADHLEELCLDQHRASGLGDAIHVLELGAGAGLPSILIAKTHPFVKVTVSDYPDVELIKSLSENVRRNNVADRCRAVPYAWGTSIAPLIEGYGHPDVIVAADTLWNPDLHILFIESLILLLKKSSNARVEIIAGLHTGRYTIQAFLNSAKESGLEVRRAVEREVSGSRQRNWNVSRAEQEDERERRQWIIWITLAWPRSPEGCPQG